MTRFWTSDLHINHGNIIEYCNRPFWHEVPVISVFGEGTTEAPDVDTMNQTLLDNYNDRVRLSDEVWFVGDLVMGSFKKSIEFMRLFHGDKYLIPGNHDRCHKMFPKWAKFQPYYEAVGFTVLDSEVATTVGDQSVKVCHFPYTGDSHERDRYSGNRPMQEGGWLIHGHTHSSERVDYTTRSIHVGVDAWDYAPVSESQIEKIIHNTPSEAC